MNSASALRHAPLGDLCHLFQGLSVSRQPEGGEECPLVQIRDIEYGRINQSGLTGIPASGRIIADYGLQPGDVLISARGTIGKLAFVGERETGMILSSNLVALRAKTNTLSPEFLYACLSTPAMQQHIQALVRPSTTVKSVRVADLQELPIPIPSYEQQRRLGELALAHDRYRLLAQACIEASRNVVDAVVQAQFNPSLKGGSV